jgi:putative transposase
MHINGEKLPQTRKLAGLGKELSREALIRLAWFDFHRTHSKNVALTCRHFGISRQTFYVWRRRFDRFNLFSLEGGSHRPLHPRKPTWTPQLAQQVLALRQRFPRWGKDKLVVLLAQQGLTLSTSMVGRILLDLRQRRLLIEPLRAPHRSRRWLRPRPYAVRKPKEYRPSEPGDLIQIDTLDVRPLPGVAFKHFTARDVVSRWDVLEAHSRATAAAAAHFLDTVQRRMPFPIRAVQVDGGSEFAAEFEQACQQRGLRLFVLPPRSPKLNGAVERAHRTHSEEFYQVTPHATEIAPLNQELLAWETIYNTIRPHQALHYLTPHQFLLQWHSYRKD